MTTPKIIIWFFFLFCCQFCQVSISPFVHSILPISSFVAFCIWFSLAICVIFNHHKKKCEQIESKEDVEDNLKKTQNQIMN
jgi:hypothetical protein